MPNIQTNPAEPTLCTTCHTPFPSSALVIAGRELFRQRTCGACLEQETLSATRRRAAEAQHRREAEWLGICPATYRDTHPSDARLNPQAIALASAWNAASGSRGFGLIGGTGAGKTRCAFLALRRAFEAGRRVFAISHARLARTAIEAYSGSEKERVRAKSLLRRLTETDVLLLDDLGKPPSTERADAELEELIEARTSEGRPILWTANSSGQWLIERFGTERGEPLVRRLAEFCDVKRL
jgi:chromosomal replication initiation ATPase DnaA